MRAARLVDWAERRHRDRIRKRANQLWDQMTFSESKVSAGTGYPLASINKPESKRKEH